MREVSCLQILRYGLTTFRIQFIVYSLSRYDQQNIHAKFKRLNFENSLLFCCENRYRTPVEPK